MGGMEYIEGDAEQELIFHGSKAVLEALKKKSNLKKKIGRLAKQVEKCNKDVTHLVGSLNKTRKELLLGRSLSKEISVLRAEIIALRGIESSEDSTVREIGEARRSVSLKIAQLQKICPHDFLMGYDGYEGSYSYDHDDAYPGQRKCIVCGLTDREKDSVRKENGVYELLPVGDWRFRFYESETYAQFYGRVESTCCDTLIEPSSDCLMVRADREGFYKIDIWKSFEELLPGFKNA